MISVSFTTLAKFAAYASKRQQIASSAKDAAKARKKREDDSEEFIPASYYSRAAKLIREYHKNKLTINWLHEQAQHLVDTAAQEEKKQTKIRILHNARVLSEYCTYGAKRKLLLEKNKKLVFLSNGLQVNAITDMRVIESGIEKWIVFDCKKELYDRKDFILQDRQDLFRKFKCQLVLAAVVQGGYLVEGAIAEIFHIASGTSYKAERISSSRLTQIERVCGEFVKHWRSA